MYAHVPPCSLLGLNPTNVGTFLNGPSVPLNNVVNNAKQRWVVHEPCSTWVSHLLPAVLFFMWASVGFWVRPAYPENVNALLSTSLVGNGLIFLLSSIYHLGNTNLVQGGVLQIVDFAAVVFGLSGHVVTDLALAQVYSYEALLDTPLCAVLICFSCIFWRWRESFVTSSTQACHGWMVHCLEMEACRITLFCFIPLLHVCTLFSLLDRLNLWYILAVCLGYVATGVALTYDWVMFESNNRNISKYSHVVWHLASATTAVGISVAREVVAWNHFQPL